jgi:hypothetical protein
MNLSKKLVLALAGTSIVAPLAPLAASAQEIAALNGRAAVNDYMQQQDVDTFKAWASRNQVTSVNQFSDVKPTDWAYQALSNLVAKYGCVAGYPDGKFKGAQAMSRFEAAALLNACLDRVTEKTDELQKLLDEFDKELTVLTARVDGLENKVGKLQAQQFSTTTRLRGEASMILGGIPGYTKGGTQNGNTTFNYDSRINFDTSYYGQDLLRTRLRSVHFSAHPCGSSIKTVFKLDKAESYQNGVFIDRLYYTFPVGKDKTFKLTVGALVRNTELTFKPTAYQSDILDWTNLGGTSGVYNKATGPGVGIQWAQKVPKGKGGWLANVNYVVSGQASCGKTTTTTTDAKGNKSTSISSGTCLDGGKNGSDAASSEYGFFNGASGINATAQIGYKASQWGAAVGYRYGSQGTNVRDSNGPSGQTLAYNQTDNSVAFNAYWQPKKTGAIPSISAGYGYNFVSGGPVPGYSALSAEKKGAVSQYSKYWFVGLQWDDAFIKGNAAGVSFGQPNYAAGATLDSPWLAEFFYKYQVSNNVSITPTLFYASGVNNNKENSNGPGQSSFSGLGGVIQTVFKF